MPTKQQPKREKIPRSEVYAAIDSEREYQDRLGCDRTELCDIPVEERFRSVAEYIVMLQTYVQQATNEWTKNAGDEDALHQIRKIAGIAVHCMEDNGAPKRVNKVEVDAKVFKEPEMKLVLRTTRKGKMKKAHLIDDKQVNQIL